MAATASSKAAVIAALIGNLLVAVTKFVAAAWTGSSSMTSEAVHSLVDTGNEVLLLYGIHRSSRGPDRAHPLGHGRELYFWSFIVALLVFALGAAVSIYEGIDHLLEPHAVTDPLVNYVVLGLALLFEGGSWWVSLRQFSSAKGDCGWWQAFRDSKDPPSFVVLFEDSAALAGIVIAALGTFASSTLRWPLLDGVASIAIGVVLAVTSVLIARESKSLLIGERSDWALVDALLATAAGQPAIESANGVLTLQLAPDQAVAALSVHFRPTLSAADVEEAILALEDQVRAAHPTIVALFVKPETDRAFRDSIVRRYGAIPPWLPASGRARR